MMGDLTRKQDIVNIIKERFPADYCDDGSNQYAEGYGDALNDVGIAVSYLSSVEPERKKGKWIRITQGAIPEKYICPFCHREVEIYGVEELLPIKYPFCHCGADMRGEDNETD